MNRSRPILNSINDMRYYMSTKPKVPNHYETLKISSQSTQEEIKSAYYDLSKKYHPDVNKASDAKQQFQDVSDAYETLGNFDKRKQYDRDLAARGGHVRVPRTVYPTMDKDPIDSYFRSRTANFDRSNQRNFDFDTWTQAHYGQTLRRSLKDKQSKILRAEMQRQHEKDLQDNKATRILVSFVSTICIICLALQAYLAPEYDRNLIRKDDKRS